MNKTRWDIFCKIVDNFGDIGVCWRLAKQLKSDHNFAVRLFVDDLVAAKNIIPALNVEFNQQIIDEIKVLSWHGFANENHADFNDAADVVIETFACDLPMNYIDLMVEKKSTWINLEYLSAESWVADFHAKPSPQKNGLIRHFYFPGFTENTGGLIREKNTATNNQQLKYDAYQNLPWKTSDLTTKNALKISLFCYPHAPVESLLSAMAESNQPINCYVPASSILPKITDFFGLSTLSIGEIYQLKNLNLYVLPFLSQHDYDQLLSDCDLNFVRGEDSWVRANWAGKPFIWQPYFQHENTHMKKLDAFLDVFYAGFAAKKAVVQMHTDWVEADLTPLTWQNYLNQLPHIADYTLQQSQQLAKQTDLATKLVAFCNQIE